MIQPAPSNVSSLRRLPHIAMLTNVLLLRDVIEQLRKRIGDMPGIGVFYGRAGLGKTNACSSAAAAYDAVYVTLRDDFTRKSFLGTVLHDMGVKAAGTAAHMFDQVAEELEKSRKPLILDMGDYLVKRKLIDTLLDLYEAAHPSAVVLVGEERFPASLERASERFYDRVLVWRPAVPCSEDDARKLAKLYSPEVEIRDDLLRHTVERTAGVARKVSVNIENFRREGKSAGLRSIGLKEWADKPLYTGEPPRRPS